VPYLILIIFFPITYYITHPLMDYREPIEPAILVLAVCGAVPLRRWSEGNWMAVGRAEMPETS
jgi:hypothetical protein